MKRINPYRLFIGAFLPNWLLVQPEISAMAKIVYARLAQFAGKHGFAHPKQPTLAASVGCPVRNLQRYIDELKQYKLIESVQQGLGKANIYYFLWHPWMEEGTELTEEDIDALNAELTPVTPKVAELGDATLATDTPFLAEPDTPEMAEQVTPPMAYPVTPPMAEPLKGGRESVEDRKDTPAPSSTDADEVTSNDSPAAKFVAWWNEQIVPLGGRPFSLDDADDKFFAKANKALKAKSSRGFWERVKQGFEASSWLQGKIPPKEGQRRFKATLPWLLSLHKQKGIANYVLVASGEWADDPAEQSERKAISHDEVEL